MSKELFLETASKPTERKMQVLISFWNLKHKCKRRWQYQVAIALNINKFTRISGKKIKNEMKRSIKTSDKYPHFIILINFPSIYSLL